jgi:4a-hydroxytetrahydrobiopterin dehydratase
MQDDKILSKKHCKPCEGGMPPLSRPKNLEYLKQVNEWQLIEDKSIEKILLFKDFMEALVFVNKVADIAESEGHHPDILIFGWNKVKISLSTHSIGGLSDNDFILAAKIDEVRM